MMMMMMMMMTMTMTKMMTMRKGTRNVVPIGGKSREWK